MKKLDEVKGERNNTDNNNKEKNPKYQNFEFTDFTTFSKNENPTISHLISKSDNCNVMTTAASNNFPPKKLYVENDLISLKENSSQYKSIKSNNTLNNYCSIHQINGNFQTHDIEYNQLSNITFLVHFIYLLFNNKILNLFFILF